MTTTPPASADEPIDPAVRSMLWRLRARLVTPPDHDRVGTDLDRLLAAAREHAHGDEPEATEPIRIIPPVVADAASGHPGVVADDEGHGAGAATGPTGGTDAEVVPIEHRGWHLTTLVGRVAAAAVLVMAVGGGFAYARDAGPLTIQALLGRTPTAPIEQAPLAADDDALTPEVVEEDADELPEPRAVPIPDDEDDDALQPDTDVPAGGDADDAGTPAPRESTPDEAPVVAAPEPSSGSDNSSSGNGGGSSTGSSGSNGSTGTSGGGSSQPRDDAEVVDEPAEEIVAAPAPADPPPSNVVGSGGPTPCPEDAALEDCLKDRETKDEDTKDSSGSGSSGATDEDDDSAKDELKKRRGGG